AGRVTGVQGGSTSRTSTSTTTPPATPDWSSWWSTRPAPTTWRPRSGSGAGRTIGEGSANHVRPHPATSLSAWPGPPTSKDIPVSARTGVVVAIDGPSGSGKSSTSRGAATRLGLRYLDTGAMYRAMTWWMLRHGVPVADTA